MYHLPLKIIIIQYPFSVVFIYLVAATRFDTKYDPKQKNDVEWNTSTIEGLVVVGGWRGLEDVIGRQKNAYQK